MFQRLLSKVRGGLYLASVQSTYALALTAAGANATNALQLGEEDIQVVGTTAAGTGVKLPAPSGAGDTVAVYNKGANALLVYPQTGGQINALTVTTAGFSVAAGARAFFECIDGTNWMAVLSA